MPIESPQTTFYLLSVAMFALSATFLEIFIVEISITLTLIFKMTRGPVKRPYAIFYLLAKAMFALSVTVCEILSVEMCMTFTVTFRICQGKM